jgi:hypothetical protein
MWHASSMTAHTDLLINVTMTRSAAQPQRRIMMDTDLEPCDEYENVKNDSTQHAKQASQQGAHASKG